MAKTFKIGRDPKSCGCSAGHYTIRAKRKPCIDGGFHYQGDAYLYTADFEKITDIYLKPGEIGTFKLVRVNKQKRKKNDDLDKNQTDR